MTVVRSALLKAATGIVLASVAMSALAREKRLEIEPYLEVNQTVLTDIKGGDGDVLAYSSAAAGIDARMTTRDAEGQANVRYEHQFGWGRNVGDQDIISGIARVRVDPVRDLLHLEAGGLATRTSSAYVGASGGSLAGSDAIAKIYSGYVSPMLTTTAGDLTINASYLAAYNKVQQDSGVSFGGQRLNSFDSSLYQSAKASVGMQPGPLPVGWSVGVGYDREDAKPLDQLYQDKWARADLTLPVSPTTAIVGGIGYDDLKIGQRDVLRDANGDPVISSSGRLVTDKSSPRQLSYDFDGLMWDVGVLWRPSRRTSLEARFGQRYGSWRFTGNLTWQPDRDSSVSVTVFDGIDSFGRLMNGSLVGLGTSFNVQRNPFSGDLNTCAYGAQGGGQCFNDALSALSAANFRHRGINAQYSAERGAWNWGVAGGYARRKFIAPDGSVFAEVNGATDENYYLNLFAGRKIDQRSGVNGTVYANYYNSGVDGVLDVLNAGAYASYYRDFNRRLTGTASVGVDGVDPKGIDSIISALAQISLRYQF
ncbi:MAG TPA: hypothetical protein VF509_05350 [Sphingobium sp.]